MKEFDQQIITDNASLLDALVALNSLCDRTLTLFVVDSDNHLVGTLTDGDIRRGLIKGYSLTDKVAVSMHKSFSFFYEQEKDKITKIKSIRQRGVKTIPVVDSEMHIVDVVNLLKFKSLLPVDAILMAGGKGERLRPLTERTPKPLLRVGNKSIIDYNVERLISYGVKHISVTVNYLREQIEDHFSNPINGIHVHCVREPEFLGTMGSVKFVKEFVNDTVLVMNSDLFTNIDFEDFYLHFKEHDADMSVAAVPYTVKVPYGIFDLDGRNIKGVLEKPTYNYFANAGIYLLKRSIIDSIPEGKFYNATDLMNSLISSGRKVVRFPIAGYWIDIGNKEELAKAQELVKHTSL